MPQEETRKIIQVGSSFAVTLPRGWVRYYKLKLKDSVLVVTNGCLTIKPLAPKPTES